MKNEKEWIGTTGKVVFPAILEGYSPENMVDILPQISRMGFIRVASHLQFCWENRHFRKNTIYFFCVFEYSIVQTYDEEASLLLVFPTPHIYEYKARHPKIKIDMMFRTTEGNPIGWYNKGKNILYLSDILHFTKNYEYGRIGLSRLRYILDHIEKK